MKCTIILLLAACLQVSASGYSQTISVKLRDVSFEKALKEVAKKSGYQVFYQQPQIKQAKAVSLVLENTDVKQVLDELFKAQPLKYEITNKTIVVSPKEVKSLAVNEGESVREGSPIIPPTVRGRITNEKNEPVAGVSISIKGGKVIGVTNDNGEFVLNNVADNAVLVFSAVSIETFETKLNGRTELALSAKVKINELQEVVINKGYYEEKERTSVSNVGRVKAKDIERQPVSNVLQAIQGRVPGLQITQQNGIPGGGITVRIQGQNSLANGNDPFIVIDGVPYYSQLPRAGNDGILGEGSNGNFSGGSPLAFLNPADIESIDVLKDADATAIYGSRAANGALLITTKKGRIGKAILNVNIQTGWGQVAKGYEVLNRRQYLDMRYEAYKNDGIALNTLTPNSRTWDLTVWDTTRETNWRKELIGKTATYTNATVGLSGGTEAVQYQLSSGYRRETTVFPGNFYDQNGSVHFSLTAAASRKVKVHFKSSFMMADNRLPVTDVTADANKLEPIAPALYNSDGSLNWALLPSGQSTWENHPTAALLYREYNRQTSNLITNLKIEYSILPKLQFLASFGYNTIRTTEYSSFPLTALRPEERPFALRKAQFGSKVLNSWIIEPQLNYGDKFGELKLQVLLGASVQQNKGNSGYFEASGFANDQVMQNFRAATTLIGISSIITQYKYNALFSHASLDFKDRYILSLNVRRDGSSRFGANNKLHDFGSIGGAWIFTDEKFMQRQKLLTFGKIRMSYGTTGSDQIPDYRYLNVYSNANYSNPYQGGVGIFPGNLPNPYLQWEETRKLQMGFDLKLFNNRLEINATYVRNRSSNQLISYALPTITGYSAILTNFPATLQNTGLEFGLSHRHVKAKNFEWSSQLNLTFPRNKLVAFPDIEKSTYSLQYTIGYPIDYSRSFSFAGVNASSGLYQVYDKDGMATTTPNSQTDKIASFSRLPRFSGGLSSSITIKRFQADLFFQFASQRAYSLGYFNNGSSVAPGVFISGASNQPVSVLGRWQQPGDVTNIQRFTSGFGSVYDQLNVAMVSDGVIEDASYMRLKNITLTYNMPLPKINKTIRLYVSAQNLLTWTKYKSGDPETQSNLTLPPLKMITVGFQFNL